MNVDIAIDGENVYDKVNWSNRGQTNSPSINLQTGQRRNCDNSRTVDFRKSPLARLSIPEFSASDYLSGE